MLVNPAKSTTANPFTKACPQCGAALKLIGAAWYCLHTTGCYYQEIARQVTQMGEISYRRMGLGHPSTTLGHPSTIEPYLSSGVSAEVPHTPELVWWVPPTAIATSTLPSPSCR